MPKTEEERLADGWTSAIISTKKLPVPPEVWAAFLAAQDKLLQPFRIHPDLLESPYYTRKFRLDGIDIPLPISMPFGNPIHRALVETGLDCHRWTARAAFPEWERAAELIPGVTENDRSAYAGGYALISLVLLFIKLMNLYVPNRTLIYNLYSTNVRVDAIGREDLTASVLAVSKLVKRSLTYSGEPMNPDVVYEQAQILLHILKADRAAHQPAVSKNRGISFERRCVAALIDAGFEVQETPKTGDFGADIVAMKDDLSFAIQCKDTSKPVGVKAVQEAVSARAHYGTDYAVVCASSSYTYAALELSSSNKVVLCGLEELARKLDGL